jgi:folylpolyglutamate synthase/dihydropteroate synthase
MMGLLKWMIGCIAQLGATEAGPDEETEILTLLEAMEKEVVVRPSVQAALEDVCATQGGEGRRVDIFVTGSLYVVGDGLAIVQPP